MANLEERFDEFARQLGRYDPETKQFIKSELLALLDRVEKEVLFMNKQQLMKKLVRLYDTEENTNTDSKVKDLANYYRILVWELNDEDEWGELPTVKEFVDSLRKEQRKTLKEIRENYG